MRRVGSPGTAEGGGVVNLTRLYWGAYAAYASYEEIPSCGATA